MVENKLLLPQRAHAVAQEDEWAPWVFALGDDAEGNHVLHELVKTSRPEITEVPWGLSCPAVSAMIVPINNQTSSYKEISQRCVPSDVLAKPMRDLNDASGRPVVAPLNTGDGQTI